MHTISEETTQKWWKLEGKIECGMALLALIISVAFWENISVQIGGLLSCGLWCIGKIYFRRDRWLVLLIIALYMFQQGLSLLYHNM